MKHESARAVEDYPISPASSESSWLVKTSSGVHTWTLDELDLAFQRGEVDAATPVRTSGMTEWQTLGVVADLDAPAATDISAAATPEPSSARRLPPPPARHLPPPPTSGASPPPRHLPPPLVDGRSSPPTTAPVFGDGTSAWSTITPPTPEPQTAVRSKAAAVPFAVRRRFRSVLDFGSDLMSHLRAVHPRWAAVGPWVFGAGLSGIFISVLYQLASAPTHAGAHTRNDAAVSSTAASAAASRSDLRAREPAAAAATAPSGLSASLSNGGAVRPLATSSAAAGEPHAATRASSTPSADAAASNSADGDVPGTRTLKAASSHSDRRATSSGRAKAKAKTWSKRSKARAARKARRSQRASLSAE